MALDGTFGGLKASIADFLNRSDLSAAIPDFVTMATAALTRRLIADGPVREMLATWSPTITTELTALPADFYGVKSFYIATLSDSGQVQFAEPEKIAEQKILRANQDGDPQLYSIVGSNLQLWPWGGAGSSGSYTGTIGYWQKLTALVSDGDTNWLLTKHPDAYLYTSLIQSAPYLKDDSRLQVWGELAVNAVTDIVETDKKARLAPSISAAILPYTAP